MATNDAVTVQLAVIAPVVYVVPESEPLQPETEDIEYPEFGEIVNVVVEPELTDVLDVGEMEPPVPAEVETV